MQKQVIELKVSFVSSSKAGVKCSKTRVTQPGCGQQHGPIKG